ncbi:MAG: NAD(P)/FAD-dependent oxidoreductase [Xanthomonadales bacterium]|nr:NAD(P)/FAD-dependent oxidoreductase [Xanthomonadales bacterium]
MPVTTATPDSSPRSSGAACLPGRADVAVVGGGPAGSTMASLLARDGLSVVLLEKDDHPRFHIGESLLPHNMKIIRELGLVDRVAALGVFKPGADFTSDAVEEQRHEIRFDEALDVPAGCGHAWQVRRSDFDRMLFDHAAACGAQACQNARVRQIDFDSADPELTVDHAGAERRLKVRFVVDASGRDALLAKRFELQRRNRKHGTAALYGHFRNVPRRDGEAAGNISIYWFEHGWIWMIPLADGVMSVGAVCNPDYLRRRGRDVEGFFFDTLAHNPHAGERMRTAELASAITATGNYSYSARRLMGRRWLLVGDAGAFVDPVFSSGVFFAMYSARLGADIVRAEAAGDRPAAARARRAYRRKISRGLRELSWFIYRFPAPAMRHLFLNPSNVFGLRQAVISVLAGDLHDNARVRWRLRLFRLIYSLMSLRYLSGAIRARRQRLRNAQPGFDHAA